VAGLHLHTDKDSAVTKVPNIFIDEFMVQASGDYVKVYLYLLRCMTMADCHCSVSEMADRFDYTENDIRRALKYWEKMQLIRLEYDTNGSLTGICLMDTVNRSSSSVAKEVSAVTSPAVTETAAVSSPAVQGQEKKKNYSMDEMKDFASRSEVQSVLFSTEHYLGKNLTPTDIRTLYYWYDDLGLSTDLIEYLIESCVSKGHKSLRYMEKIAISWAESNIKTVDDARRASSDYNKDYYAVMRFFGIKGRALIDSEISFIDKWLGEYGFSLAIIEEACKRTIMNAGKASFEYADSILKNWLKNGVNSSADIQRLDASFKGKKPSAASAKSVQSVANNKFNNFEQRQYDYDALEQQLVSYKRD